MLESERLARELFRRSALGNQAESLAFLHPEAEIAPTHNPSLVVSPTRLGEHLASDEEPRVIDARGDKYTPLDDDRIIVEGQVRIRRVGGGFDYRSAVWALVFREGLLYRSWALRSVLEAEARLAGFAPAGEPTTHAADAIEVSAAVAEVEDRQGPEADSEPHGAAEHGRDAE